MAIETHGRWPRAAAVLAAPAWASMWKRRAILRRGDAWVAGLALPILLAHQSEEWVRPGGFLPFCNRRLLGSDSDTWPLSERDGFHVNVSAGWGSAIAAGLLWRRTATPAAAVLWIEAGNAAMHSSMAPHAATGAVAVHRSGRLSRRGALLAAAAGIGFSAALPLAMKLRMRARCA